MPDRLPLSGGSTDPRSGLYASSDRRFSTVRELIAVARYEWSVRRAWRTRKAALRGLWWTFVRRYPGEVCEHCGRPVAQGIATSWRAPDALWKRVVGSSHGTLCPRCFTVAARAFGVSLRWEPVTDA